MASHSPRLGCAYSPTAMKFLCRAWARPTSRPKCGLGWCSSRARSARSSADVVDRQSRQGAQLYVVRTAGFGTTSRKSYRAGAIPPPVPTVKIRLHLTRASAGHLRSSGMEHKVSSHVVLVGCGAVGSFLAALLARMPGITHITLVDPDTFTVANLRNQDIFPCDVGQLKVAALARRLRTANPALEVTAIPVFVEDVPAGLLRADLIVACVDSLR